MLYELYTFCTLKKIIITTQYSSCTPQGNIIKFLNFNPTQGGFFYRYPGIWVFFILSDVHTFGA